MCIIETFTEIYPNDVEAHRKRMTPCDDRHIRHPCNDVRSYEHPPLHLPYNEDPAMTTVVETCPQSPRSSSSRASRTSGTSRSGSSKSNKAIRPYLKKGELIYVDFNMPSLSRRKSKRKSNASSDHEEIVTVVEDRIPVPPPHAPMPPTYGHETFDLPMRPQSGIRHGEREDDIIAIEEHRPHRRRTHHQPPIVHNAAPGGSIEPSTIRIVEVEPHTSHRAAPTPTRRRDVEVERPSRLQAEEAEARRRHNIAQALAEQARERERTRLRNIEMEQEQQARDRANRVRREVEEQRRQEEERAQTVRESFRRGGSADQRRRSPVEVSYTPEDGRSSGEESFVSAPGRVRVIPRRHHAETMMERGEWILDEAVERRRQQLDEDERRMRQQDRARRAEEGSRRGRRG
ncbi:MAG: hypothetical protein M1833_006083 [Piccolia ochrophora]|nr:MAG: hypothetical protein M1833_006083 [Piccolia ochrophora]